MLAVSIARGNAQGTLAALKELAAARAGRTSGGVVRTSRKFNSDTVGHNTTTAQLQGLST